MDSRLRLNILNLLIDLEIVQFMKKVAIFLNGDIVFFICMKKCIGKIHAI